MRYFLVSFRKIQVSWLLQIFRLKCLPGGSLRESFHELGVYVPSESPGPDKSVWEVLRPLNTSRWTIDYSFRFTDSPSGQDRHNHVWSPLSRQYGQSTTLPLSITTVSGKRDVLYLSSRVFYGPVFKFHHEQVRTPSSSQCSLFNMKRS